MPVGYRIVRNYRSIKKLSLEFLLRAIRIFPLKASNTFLQMKLIIFLAFFSMIFFGMAAGAVLAESADPPGVQQPNVEETSSGIPPEVLEQIIRLSTADKPVRGTFEPLSVGYRFGLIAVAGLILATGAVFCRYIGEQRQPWLSEQGIFLLFGLFGAISGLLIASAAVGCLYLHLAGAICTIISGFSITAFLLPQFNIIRKWIVVCKKPPNKPSD